MGKWKSLFIPIFLSSRSLECLIQDAHTFVNRWSAQCSQVQNIYVLIYIQEHIEHNIYTHDIQEAMKGILQSLCNSCPLLEECSVEIKFSSHAVKHMSAFAQTKCVYHIIELCSHLSLNHIHIFFRFILYDMLFRWLYQHNYLSAIHNAFTLFSVHTYSYALELTANNVSTALSTLASYDMYTKIKHISVDWGSISYDAGNAKERVSIVQKAQEFGFISYQYWHFYREEKKYSSGYLDSCYYMLPYLGIKYNKGRKKTVSWMQGKKESTHSFFSSAIGTYTDFLKWRKISAWEELSLRCINSSYGIVYIPHYLCHVLGNSELQLFKKKEGFRVIVDEDSMPYHGRNDYIHNGEFWSR